MIDSFYLRILTAIAVNNGALYRFEHGGRKLWRIFIENDRALFRLGNFMQLFRSGLLALFNSECFGHNRAPFLSQWLNGLKSDGFFLCAQ